MLGKISTRETGEARRAVRVKERIMKSVRERDHRWGNVLANFYVLFTGSHLHLDSSISSERGYWHGNLSNSTRALSRNIEVERNIQNFTFVWSGSNLGQTSRSKLLLPCVHTRKEHSKRLPGFLSRRKVVSVNFVGNWYAEFRWAETANLPKKSFIYVSWNAEFHGNWKDKINEV